MILAISDHALVRFIERYKGESLQNFRDEMLALLRSNEGNAIPDHGYDDGWMFVIESGDPPTVVTVLTPGMRPKHMPGRNQRRIPWSTRTLVHIPGESE